MSRPPWPVLAIFVYLGGCALPSVPPPGALNAEERNWLAGLQSRGWRLNGRIGVISGEKRGWHAGLRWEYLEGVDALVISGPLGQGGVALWVRPGWIRIRYPDGRVQESARPRELLRRILGVAVPLESLHYWILGLPAPAPAKPEYDLLGRLRLLDQDGWQVEYRRYLRLGPGALPAKLILTGPGRVRVTLIVDEWRIGVEPGKA